MLHQTVLLWLILVRSRLVHELYVHMPVGVCNLIPTISLGFNLQLCNYILLYILPLAEFLQMAEFESARAISIMLLLFAPRGSFVWGLNIEQTRITLVARICCEIIWDVVNASVVRYPRIYSRAGRFSNPSRSAKGFWLDKAQRPSTCPVCSPERMLGDNSLWPVSIVAWIATHCSAPYRVLTEHAVSVRSLRARRRPLGPASCGTHTKVVPCGDCCCRSASLFLFSSD